jgi:hypothetical protein
MRYTGTYTSVVKVAEFEEITQSLVENKIQNSHGLIALLEKQTTAKQKKFWKYFDSHTFMCDGCGYRQFNDKKVERFWTFCSDNCASEFYNQINQSNN